MEACLASVGQTTKGELEKERRKHPYNFLALFWFSFTLSFALSSSLSFSPSLPLSRPSNADGGADSKEGGGVDLGFGSRHAFTSFRYMESTVSEGSL